MSDGKIKGTVHLVEETKTYGQKGFRKRLVVIEQDNGRFTNYIPVEFTNDRCETVNDLKEGDQIEVTYRLNGRKWQKDPTSEVKFFLNAEATDFTVIGSSEANSSAYAASANDELAEAAFDDDEVPF